MVQFKDDSHPLDKPQTTMDCVLLKLLWYEKYLDWIFQKKAIKQTTKIDNYDDFILSNFINNIIKM